MIIIILPQFHFHLVPSPLTHLAGAGTALPQDCEAHILGRDPHGTVTAVCALPMDPDSRSPGFLDWIWLGVSSGDMFGILLEESLGAGLDLGLELENSASKKEGTMIMGESRKTATCLVNGPEPR